jgi:flagellar biogenesis protein FliO
MLNIIHLALLPISEPEAGGYGGLQGTDLMPLLRISVILIIAIGGLAWGFKKFIAGNIKARAGKRSLQVLDMLPLGGKQKLAVVRCYDRTFALGLGEKEITAIAELDPVIGSEEQPSDGALADEATFQRALAHVQAALSKTREGVGPRPLRAEAKRQATVAQLLNQVDEQSTRRATAAPQQARPANTEQVVQAAEPAQRTQPARKPKTRKRAAAKANADAAQPAPARKALRKPAPAPEPITQVQTLGLEGLMG